MLEQAVLNLIRNALDAGTEVRLEASAAWIRITDNGPGLPPEIRRKLFQPFMTTKAQGTGLGLVIVRNIVQALHGEVDLHQGKPSGTCAEIRWSTKR
ncbi:MAG: sensor histidine kinase [Paludibaculum sp.]